MRSRKLLSLIMSVIITGSCLTGCETVKEKPPDVTESNNPAAETSDEEPEISFSFTDLSNLEFWFGSGAGAWRTVLTVQDDGTFEGEYLDSDMEIGDAYPNGTQYFCSFTGEFTEPVKVDEYTYSVKIEQIKLAEEPGIEEIKDGIKFVYREPYGLDDAEEILFYLPGAPVQELPKEYRNWMNGYGDHIDTQLPFYGLYNVNTGRGFSSHEIEENIGEFPNVGSPNVG